MSKKADKFITRPEVAKYLDISLSTLDRMLRDKMIPFIKLRGRVFFTKSGLDEWLKELEEISREHMKEFAQSKAQKNETRIYELYERIATGDYENEQEELEFWAEIQSLSSADAEKCTVKKKIASPVKRTCVIVAAPDDSPEKIRKLEKEALDRGERPHVISTTQYSVKGRKQLDREREEREQKRREGYTHEHVYSLDKDSPQ